jgi:hypothetical protein
MAVAVAASIAYCALVDVVGVRAIASAVWCGRCWGRGRCFLFWIPDTTTMTTATKTHPSGGPTKEGDGQASTTNSSSSSLLLCRVVRTCSSFIMTTRTTRTTATAHLLWSPVLCPKKSISFLYSRGQKLVQHGRWKTRPEKELSSIIINFGRRRPTYGLTSKKPVRAAARVFSSIHTEGVLSLQSRSSYGDRRNVWPWTGGPPVRQWRRNGKTDAGRGEIKPSLGP